MAKRVSSIRFCACVMGCGGYTKGMIHDAWQDDTADVKVVSSEVSVDDGDKTLLLAETKIVAADRTTLLDAMNSRP